MQTVIQTSKIEIINEQKQKCISKTSKSCGGKTKFITFLVCHVIHVISQDHVIKRSCDFMGGSSSL